MVMMVLSSIVAGYNDLKYHRLGYLAMFVNVATNLLHVQVRLGMLGLGCCHALWDLRAAIR